MNAKDFVELYKGREVIVVDYHEPHYNGRYGIVDSLDTGHDDVLGLDYVEVRLVAGVGEYEDYIDCLVNEIALVIEPDNAPLPLPG